VAAWLPGGRALAVLSGTQATSEVHLASGGRARRLLALPGRLDGLLVSPDGRWLLLDARDADQWLLMRTSGTGRLAARSGVARQFDPGGSGPGRAPRTVAWIR